MVWMRASTLAGSRPSLKFGTHSMSRFMELMGSPQLTFFRPLELNRQSHLLLRFYSDGEVQPLAVAWTEPCRASSLGGSGCFRVMSHLHSLYDTCNLRQLLRGGAGELCGHGWPYSVDGLGTQTEACATGAGKNHAVT